jgi:hypothetical protein
LEGEGIQATLEDEFLGMIAPYLSSPGGTQPVKVVVSTSDAEKARPNVEDFVKKGMGER